MMLSMLQVREGKQILGDIEKLKEESATTNVDQVVGLGLQRKKEYAVGDIAYAMGLPLSLCLECVTPGTTGSESPDFSGKKAGDTLEDGTAVFAINKKSNTTAEQLTTARTIDGVNFNGTGNIVHYGSCSTAAATAEKAVACAGFVLAIGAKIAVKFTVTNTAANPTLNVQSTGAKPVYYRGAAISAGYLAANRTYEFVYNGTQYELIGDLDTNTAYTHPTTSGNKHIPSGGSSGQFLGWNSDGTAEWVANPNTDTLMTQNISSANATYPVLLCPTADAEANQGAKTGVFCSGVKVNPSTSTVSAKTFSGALSGNASSASKISGKTICVVSSFDASTGTLNLTSLS